MMDCVVKMMNSPLKMMNWGRQERPGRGGCAHEKGKTGAIFKWFLLFFCRFSIVFRLFFDCFSTESGFRWRRSRHWPALRGRLVLYLKWWILALKMMMFAFKMIMFALVMISLALKMMDVVLKWWMFARWPGTSWRWHGLTRCCQSPTWRRNGGARLRQSARWV